jgi:tripartite-type tricarboxylate transporter receptor subunit TctC
MHAHFIVLGTLHAARTAGCAALKSTGTCAQARVWPAKPIRVIVPYPTVAETPGLEGYSAGSWQGMLGPAKLPAEKRIVTLPDFSGKLTSIGSRPQAKTPQEMGSWLATERERWAKVVKESGYRIE